MGLALGIMLISALELLDARFIRNEQEVSQMLGISIIGAIPPPDNRSHV
jgi:capsular polysaccharide biosynthesis protein